jgi:molybdopterin converting factor small subunit
MQVRVKLMASLRSKLPPGAKGGTAEVSVPPGTTIAAVLDQLGVGGGHVHLVMRNGEMETDRQRALEDGDELTVFPPVAGGQPPTNTPAKVAAGPGAAFGGGSRVLAGGLLLLAGLGLVVLGGCFLMGALALVTDGFNPAPPPLSASPDAGFLLSVLYTLAGTCFGVAAVLLLVGVVGLVRVLWSRPAAP